MADREKVIYSLERCSCMVPDACRDCAYDHLPARECVAQLAKDALELLKAQEPVKPTDKTCSWWDHTLGRCGHCNAPLPMLEGLKSKFCWMCGRAVKWDA